MTPSEVRRHEIANRVGLRQFYVGDRVNWLSDRDSLSAATPANDVCPSCFAPSRRLWWLSGYLFVCISTTCSLVFSSGNNRTDAATLMQITADFEAGYSIRAVAKRNGVAKETAYRQKMVQRATRSGYGA